MTQAMTQHRSVLTMDSRFPERWLNDRRIARASADQFRLFVYANTWSVSNRTDGLIPAAELSLIPYANTADAAALVALGLWKTVDGGWMIESYKDAQSSKAQLEGLDHKRRVSANASKAYRERKKAKAPSYDESPDRQHDSSYDDKGKARTGQAPDREPASEAEETNWGTADVDPFTPEADVLTCSMCGEMKQLNDDGRCESCRITW